MKRTLIHGLAVMISLHLLLESEALAQTIINVPPSPGPTSAGADTIVKLLPGGNIPFNFQGLSGSTLNVMGGRLEGGADFNGGSTLEVESGQVDNAGILAGAVANVHGGNVHSLYVEGSGVANFYGGLINELNNDGGGTSNIYDGMFSGVLRSGMGNVNVFGGAFTDSLNLHDETQLTIHATELRLNGALVGGLTIVGDTTIIPISIGGVISGVFSNGTPFVFGGEEYELPPTLKLVQSAAYQAGPATIHVPSQPAPQGIHNGQHLILSTGGQLPMNFIAGLGSVLEVQGGTVGFNFEADGATVDATSGKFSTIDGFNGSTINLGGTVEWDGLELFSGTMASIQGGSGGTFRMTTGSTANITSGKFSGHLEVDESVANVSGGEFGSMSLAHFADATISGGNFTSGVSVSSGAELLATGGNFVNIFASIGDSDLIGIATTSVVVDGANVDWLSVDEHSTIEVKRGVSGDSDAFGGELIFHGGAIGDSHEWLGGKVEIHGYDFQVNGMPIAGLDTEGDSVPWNYTAGTTITGTMSDGTPFNLAPNDNFQSLFVQDGVIKFIRSATPTLPATIVVPDSPAPYGASAGQMIVVSGGGALGDNFLAGHDSVVEIHGGVVGDNFEAERSTVLITAGTLGQRLDVFNGAMVTLGGGSMGQEFEVHQGGTLNISGGNAGSQGRAYGGTVNLSAGLISHSFLATQSSDVNISGGFVESGFIAQDGATVQVTGGSIGNNFQAGNGSEVSIAGGLIQDIRAQSGSKVIFSGGNTSDVDVLAGSQAVFTGGSFGDNFGVNSSANAAIHGSDFELNGVPIDGLDLPGNQVLFSLAAGQLFTGTLTDGTPFAFRSEEGDGIGAIKVVRSAVAPAGPSTINVPGDVAPGGVHAGQQLVLQNGGNLPDNFNAGKDSIVDILGGTVGRNFEAFAAVVNIHGGQIGNDFDAFAGSQINLLGGAIGNNLDAYSQSQVNVSGGAVTRIDALNGSAINMSGGQIANLQASNGSHTVWAGGTIGALNVSGASSTIAMHGAEFQLNGVPIAGLENQGDSLQFNLPASSFLTATLADGTPVLLNSGVNSPASNAQIANGTLTLVRSADPAMPGPAFQEVSDAIAPFSIGASQTLLVVPGGQLPANFVAGPGSSLLLHGGSVGSNLKAFGADLEITSGNIGQNFIGLQDLDLTIKGGKFGNGFSLYDGAHAIIHGGLLPTSFRVDAGAVVDLYGTSFLLNNQPIAGLEHSGESLLVTTRGGQLLKALLADGSPLEWRLTSPLSPRSPFGFSDQAILRLHLVPEPAAFAYLGSVGALLLLCRRSVTNIQ